MEFILIDRLLRITSISGTITFIYSINNNSFNNKKKRNNKKTTNNNSSNNKSDI